MAIKTFTTGEVLTASDTNAYLANAGLVYVTSTTVGSGVSSVTVSNCFSSTYDDYRIVISGGTASTNLDLYFRLGSSTANYYGGVIYFAYSGGSVGGVGQNNAAEWRYVANSGTTNSSGIIDLFGPYLTKPTGMVAQYGVMNTLGSVTATNGFHNDASSFTGFTVNTSSGTITGQKITVYGYRKA